MLCACAVLYMHMYNVCTVYVWPYYSLCTVDGDSVSSTEDKDEIVQFLLETFDQVYLPIFLVNLITHNKLNLIDYHDSINDV